MVFDWHGFWLDSDRVQYADIMIVKMGSTMRRILAIALIVFGVAAIIGGIVMLYSLKGSSDEKARYLSSPVEEATKAVI